MRTRLHRLPLAAAAAACAAAALLLAGCSTGSASTGDSGYSDSKKVTISFSWWGSADRLATTKSVLADFHKAHPNITVETQPADDINSYFAKLATETAAGDAPDVMTLGGAYPQEYGARGALLDLSTVSKYLDTKPFTAQSLTSAKVDGKLYGVPTGGNAIGLVVNTDLIEKAGMQPPTADMSWDDFVAYADELGGKLPKGDYALEMQVSDILGVFAAQETKTGMYTSGGKLGITASTLVDFWNLEKQLIKGGGMPPADVTTETQGAAPEQTLMGQGKAAMTFAYSNLTPTFAQASGDDMTIIGVPGEKQAARPGTTVLPSQYYAIYSKSKNPEAAAILIDYLVNSPAAGKKILADRGLPFNQKVLDAIKPSLDPGSRAAADYVQQVAANGRSALPPQPAGGSIMVDTTNRLDAEVIFGRQTPKQAADEWIKTMSAALNK
ncbi:ABC transporter substrate-binding protein [Gryllotalpicola ginsengisoli]|uniref:ABC transporter substrate-binding protein n=1 Tax=Gryllotalpicola ginsengisoli TaxID=444608 RepID=UPI00138AF95A|nr:sugar ABC transporter substrate-binding protein [Gryllotalpicola ginsengisoli]